MFFGVSTSPQKVHFNLFQIERIQNPTLFTQYMAKMQQMEHANAGRTHIEQTLWHGTSGAVVANINNKGFDRNYNSGNLRCRWVIRKFVEKCC